jgi:hypothetical protein
MIRDRTDLLQHTEKFVDKKKHGEHRAKRELDLLVRKNGINLSLVCKGIVAAYESGSMRQLSTFLRT